MQLSDSTARKHLSKIYALADRLDLPSVEEEKEEEKMELSKNDVLRELNLDSFEKLDANSFRKFADLTSQMSPSVLRSAVSQIRNFEGVALEAFRACSVSNSKCIEMCDKVVTALTRIVSSGEKLEPSERLDYLNKMRDFTQMAHKKDTEQKAVTLGALGTIVGGLVLACIFGGHKK